MTGQLPISDPLLALALHTSGHRANLIPTLHADEGVTHRTYWITDNVQMAQAVIDAMAQKDAAKNLQRTAPVHPFLAAKWAIEAFPILEKWLSGAAVPVPALLKTWGPLCRVADRAGREHDWLQHVWADGLAPAVRVHGARFAAALVVCGFPFYPQILPPRDGMPHGLAFPAESLTFPGLTYALLAAHLTTTVQTDPLPGFTLGEHPFDYAYQAAVTLANLPVFLAGAEKKTMQVFLKGPGTGGVIGSQCLFDESYRDSSFRDEAWEFLSGE